MTAWLQQTEKKPQGRIAISDGSTINTINHIRTFTARTTVLSRFVSLTSSSLSPRARRRIDVSMLKLKRIWLTTTPRPRSLSGNRYHTNKRWREAAWAFSCIASSPSQHSKRKHSLLHSNPFPITFIAVMVRSSAYTQRWALSLKRITSNVSQVANYAGYLLTVKARLSTVLVSHEVTDSQRSNSRAQAGRRHVTSRSQPRKTLSGSFHLSVVRTKTLAGREGDRERYVWGGRGASMRLLGEGNYRLLPGAVALWMASVLVRYHNRRWKAMGVCMICGCGSPKFETRISPLPFSIAARIGSSIDGVFVSCPESIECPSRIIE